MKTRLVNRLTVTFSILLGLWFTFVVLFQNKVVKRQEERTLDCVASTAQHLQAAFPKDEKEDIKDYRAFLQAEANKICF